MLKAILLDLDNTMVLFDEPAFYDIFFRTIIPCFEDLVSPEKFRPRLRDAILALKDNDGSVSNRQRFLDRFCEGLDGDPQQVWQRFMAFYSGPYRRLQVTVRVPEGLETALSFLEATALPLVVATNPIFPQVAQEARLGWGDINEQRFSLFTHMENMSMVKPRRGYFQQICHLLGVQPDECLMVGNDRGNDMAAGRIGMRTYLTTDADSADFASLTLTARDIPGLPEPDFSGPFQDVARIVRKLLD
jgi:FMN phosphatase YigB (HAD superfamily)